MAKETMIVFVYDTECLKDEADDPVDAVLYFHPSWVSDSQKLALCGQLMGTSFFLKDCFFKPSIISLQNGKFVLKEFGRFILAVGTDRNISDHLLQHRSDLLASIVKFFHRDLQMIFDQFQTQGQYKNISEKLYHIFETYLPILQCKGNIFQNIPKLRLPKMASNIFLDAIQTLQSCQQTKGVLGGLILYHNKVVATQLSDSITKQLVLTDPLHIRTTAELIHPIEFHVPNGVEMIAVYVDAQQYHKLAADAQRAQNLQTTQLSQSALTFQYTKRKMKRDKSLIFTNIPEEVSNTNEEQNTENCKESITERSRQKVVRPKSLHIRPTHLPLRLKNMTMREQPESTGKSINFDETDSYPEFIGRTSVCSTPMTENKILQVENVMSICANPEDSQNFNNKKKFNSNSIKIDIDKFFHNFMKHSNKQMERRNSFTDIQDSIKKLSRKFSLKSKSNNIKSDYNLNDSTDVGVLETPDLIDDDISRETDADDNSKDSQTISDPTYPMLNDNGQPISYSLFHDFLEKYYKLWDASDEMKKDIEMDLLIEQFKDLEHGFEIDENLLQYFTESKKPIYKADGNFNIEHISVERKIKSSLDKKLMSLPIKAIAEATPSTEVSQTFTRKQIGGIPLTPLMAKLSVLAFNDGVDMQTPLTQSKAYSRRSSYNCDEGIDALTTLNSLHAKNSNRADGLERAELYACGQQNMTLLLLMEEGAARQQQTVQKLFDVCVSKFPNMELLLNQTLNVNVEGEKREDKYSFICFDDKWDALQRSGPWSPVELNTLEYMHGDLNYDCEITDVIVRTNDNVFYGYKSGRTTMFYKEPAHQVTGIPPPSDPLGSVTTRAKLRLERDHSYMLF